MAVSDDRKHNNMNTERIAQMERRLVRAEEAVGAMEEAMKDIAALNDYLGSPEWLADRADDEAGRLPQGLRRGVLSEDAIWNLLERCREMKEQL